MKIVISADMEGISGIAHWNQVTPGHPEHSRSRVLMTEDVNAAVEGAYAGGASEVIVCDSHWDGLNILIEHLDPRCRLCTSLQSPHAMLQGIDATVSGVAFIGYHGKAGTKEAALDHTWSLYSVADVKVNGMPYGEIGLNAMYAGYFGVPVIAISGDQSACQEAESLLGSGLSTAVVKHAAAHQSVECLPLAESRRRIHEAMRTAMLKLSIEDHPAVLTLGTGLTLELTFYYTRFADRAALMPGTERLDGRTVSYVAENAYMVSRAFRTMVAAARD